MRHGDWIICLDARRMNIENRVSKDPIDMDYIRALFGIVFQTLLSDQNVHG